MTLMQHLELEVCRIDRCRWIAVTDAPRGPISAESAAPGQAEWGMCWWRAG